MDVTPSQAYKLFLKDPNVFKTSPASPAKFLKAYRELSEQGKAALCVTFSSKLSTEYDMACVAREQAGSGFPQTSVEVLDSLTTTATEGFFTLAVAQAATKRDSLTKAVKVAEETRDKTTLIILLETIRHVYRTGRIPKIAAQVVSILNIKPILTYSSKLVRFASAVRNKEHGIDRILQMLRDKVGQSLVHVAVMHADALNRAQELTAEFSSRFDSTEMLITKFTLAMGAHIGPSVVGVVFYSGD